MGRVEGRAAGRGGFGGRVRVFGGYYACNGRSLGYG